MPRKKIMKRRFRRKYSRGKYAYATKGYVKKYFDKNVENKYLDTNEVPTNLILGTGFLERISIISQGTTDTTRIGDKVRLKSVFIDYQIIVADNTNLVRVVVFQWFPNTVLSTPLLGDIFQYFNIGDNREVLSPYVHDYGDQFVVLHDKLYSLDLAGGGYTRAFKGTLSLRRVRKTLGFSSAGTNSSNSIWICALSDSSAAAHPTFTYLSRIVYEDA